MTLEQAYKQFGGDFSGILQRLKKEDRIKEYLGDFLEDEEFDRLKRALEEKDDRNAFRAVHTLKGVAMNLNLGNLEKACGKLTENLRDAAIDEETKKFFQQVEEEYSETVGIIAQLFNA